MTFWWLQVIIGKWAKFKGIRCICRNKEVKKSIISKSCHESIQVKSFAQIEYACVFSFGLLFLIHNISKVKPSSFPREFFLTFWSYFLIDEVVRC